MLTRILDKVRDEPAATIGVAVAVLEVFRDGADPADAIPAAVGFLIRFFVTPATTA